MQTLQEKNKAAVTRFNKAVIEQGDAQALEELIAPDFINHTAPPGMPAGPEGIRRFLFDVLRKAVTGVQVTIYDMIAEGDTVVTRKAITGTQTGDLLGFAGNGKPVTINIIDIVKLKDGRYTDHWSLREVRQS